MKYLLIAIILFIHHQQVLSQIKKVELNFNSGIQKSDFDWSIAGNGINYLSELKYNKLISFNNQFQLKAQITNRISVNLKAQYLKNLNGKASDADYGGNDRTYPDISFFNSKKGNGSALSIEGEYLLYQKQKFELLSGLGLQYKQQLFTLDEMPDNHTAAKYHALWLSPFFSIKTRGKYQKFEPFIEVSAALHRYKAVADWIFRTDFKHPKSFEQEAWGLNLQSSIGSLYSISPKLKLKAAYTIGMSKTNTGKDIAYLTDRTAETPFNGALLKFQEFTIGIQYKIL